MPLPLSRSPISQAINTAIQKLSRANTRGDMGAVVSAPQHPTPVVRSSYQLDKCADINHIHLPMLQDGVSIGSISRDAVMGVFMGVCQSMVDYNA